jgi:hypothetical protein
MIPDIEIEERPKDRVLNRLLHFDDSGRRTSSVKDAGSASLPLLLPLAMELHSSARANHRMKS